MSDRRYSEKELAEILRLAAERQAEGSPSAGYSLNEIERVGSEMGIDPKFITEASRAVGSSSSRNLPFTLTKAQPTEVYERTYEGSLSDDDWMEVVAEARAAFSSPGTVSEVSGSREWTGGNEFIQTHMAVTERDGRTRCRMTVTRQGGISAAWVGMLLTLFFSLITLFVIAKKSGNYSVLYAEPFVLLAVTWWTNRSLKQWRAETATKTETVLSRFEDVMQSGLEARLSRATSIPQDLGEFHQQT
ncbi:MAG: hypothetical protein ABUL72_01520 [Armatimonadota bacterium]